MPDLPELNQFDAHERATKINEISSDPETVREKYAVIDLEDSTYSDIGSPIEKTKLNTIRDAIRSLADEHDWPEPLGRRTGAIFDAELAVILWEILGSEADFTRHDGGRQEIWYFMTTALVPDIVCWRWPDLSEGAIRDRYLRSVRNALGRLWWRVEVLGDHASTERTKKLLKDLGEDTLVQIQERGKAIFPKGDLARKLARKLADSPSGTYNSSHVSKRLRRLLSFIEVEAIEDPATIEKFIDDCLAIDED